MNLKRSLKRAKTSDIEKATILYKNEYWIDVELWDTVGLERFDENGIYSEKYL